VDFISWPVIFISSLALVITVRLRTKDRHLCIAVFNVIVGFLLLKLSFLSLVSLSVLNFFFARNISRYPAALRALVLIINLAPLALLRFPQEFTWKSLLLPLSLCFFSLQQIGALIDIRRGQSQPPSQFPIWMAFSLFFPSLIAGPIGRWGEMRSALENPHAFDRQRGYEAVLLIMQGVFKKMVFAVPLYTITDRYFPQASTSGIALLILIAFIFRYAIWADISAHTDWSRGISTLFGIDQRPNFDRPFQTYRVTDFWRRWHMSLSSWLQDYIFLPLALSPLRRILNPTAAVIIAALTAFSALGLWHGLHISLLAMGLYKGGGALLADFLDRRTGRFRPIVGVLCMFLFVIFPTLLIKMPLLEVRDILLSQDFLSILRHGDPTFESAWLNLLFEEDGFSSTYRPIFATAVIAIFWEIMQFLGGPLKKGAHPDKAHAEGSFLSAPSRLLLVVFLFAIWLIYAEFSKHIGFTYVQI
jgi:D-alanyl-lipoteichoic acid acyltransferase DltB (MBOAT superfamily)